MLEYVLEVNELTTAEHNDLRAQVVNVTSYTQNDIVERIMKIGAGLTRSDIASVLEAEKQVISDIIADGGAVNTELFNAFPSISGVFNDPNESFDIAKHRVKINLHAGIALRTAVGDVKIKRIAAVHSGTVITAITDVKTGSVNNLLTPGRDIKISGAKLKVAGHDPTVGLFFVNSAGASITVDASDIVVNNPSEIIAVIPALASGVYQVRIITQYSSGARLLKAPHTATFDKPLTVV